LVQIINACIQKPGWFHFPVGHIDFIQSVGGTRKDTRTAARQRDDITEFVQRVGCPGFTGLDMNNIAAVTSSPESGTVRHQREPVPVKDIDFCGRVIVKADDIITL
jgi:hypothetical protein